MENSDDESWLKVGKTFGAKNKKRARAEDFFSSASENEKEEETNLNNKKEVVSDFSSDEDAKNTLSLDRIKTYVENYSKFDFTQTYLVKNLFELEDAKNKNIQSNKSSVKIYSAEEIFDTTSKLNYKKQRKFLKKFELKLIKFQNIDVVFTINLIEDESILKFLAFQKKDIPQYFHLKTNRILGIKNAKISRLLMKELNELLGVYVKERKYNKIRYFKSKDVKILDNNLRKVEQQEEFDFKRDFINFKKNIKEINEDKTSINIDYTQFDNKDRIKFQKSKALHKKINSEPYNLKAWIDYLNFHDESNLNGKANLEIKLAIIEKALLHHKQNIHLNILYLRIFNEIHFDNFNKVNDEFFHKFNQITNSKELVIEYLAFLKSRNDLNISDLRVRYLYLLKFYEKIFQESSNQIDISKIIIDILYDLISLEEDAGYYERSFNLLRSLIEINCLKSKNYQISNSDYEEYFDSEYPKLGDFEGSLGYLEYFQFRDKIDGNYFRKEDFIENFKENKNYRGLNILYDKDQLEYNPESFIFYSEIRDYVNLEISYNAEEIISYLLNKLVEFLGVNPFDQKVFSNNCGDIIDFEAINETRLLFDSKYLLYQNYKSFDKQKLTYVSRILKFVHSLNILKDKVNMIQFEICFLDNSKNEEFKLNFAKNLLKENQNNISLWLNYYQWLIFMEKFVDAEKVLKVLCSKHLNNDEINNLSIQHFVYMKNPSYTDIYSFIDMNYNLIQEKFTSCESIDLKIKSSFIKEKIIFLENIINSKELPLNTFLFVLNILLHYYCFDNQDLIVNYTKVIKIINTNEVNDIDLLRQETSFLLLRHFYFFKSINTNSEIYSPKFYVKVLEMINNFNHNNNDIFIILLTNALCKFKNPIDRDLKFLSQFEDFLNLKKSHYFLKSKFSQNENSNIYSLKQIYKQYFNISNENLFKIYYTNENKTIINTKEFYHKIVSAFITSLLNILYKKDTTGRTFLDYTLFLIDEYPYSIDIYLQIIQKIQQTYESETVKRHIKELMEIFKNKELRVCNKINNLNH